MRACRLIAVLGLVAVSSAAFGQLTAQQKRGRQIYTDGTSASKNEITALLGDESTEVPATVVPCAHCHGRDGLGIAEGGAKPPKIIWSELTKPYGSTTDNGRHRPAYTQSLLKRVITMGIDSGGNHLQTLMPRFRLSLQDMSDLLAYLQVLGTPPDAHVQGTSLHIGVILPPAAQFADMRTAVQSVLSAYFSDVNRSGGIYGRSIELRFLDLPSLGLPQVAQQRDAAVQKLLDENQLFALTASFLPSNDHQLSEILTRNRIPIIGALTQDSPTGAQQSRFAFYLYPGLTEQARSLAVFATRTNISADSQHAVVLFSNESGYAAAEAMVSEYKRRSSGYIEILRIAQDKFDSAQLVVDLRERNTTSVFLLIPPVLQLEFFQAAQKQNWKPDVFTPASLAPREVFTAGGSIADGIHLSFPALPYAENQDTEYRQLASAHHLPAEHLAAQWTALASAKLLIEGLKRSGKDLDREKLITSLESLYEFKTGVTHSLTFGSNRHIGALGAYIMSARPEDTNMTSSEWIELGEEPPVAVNR